MSLLDSPWFTGVACGVASSLIVYGATQLLESRRKRRETRQRIMSANADVLQSLRNLIGDSVLPPAGAIDALLNCSAQRYYLNREDLFTPRQIADEIIFEILNNPFLSAQLKAENCRFVLQSVHEAGAHPDRHRFGESLASYGRSDLSLVLALITFTSVLLGIVSTSLGSGTVTFNKETLVVVAVAIILPTLVLWLINLYRDLRQLRASKSYDAPLTRPNEDEFSSSNN